MPMINNKKGFSLIELMVSLAIMAIILSISAPLYESWLSKLRIKNVAEGINLGIIQTRTEAIRRNQLVFFKLNSDTSWTITDNNNNVINRKEASESSMGVNLIINPNQANFITFNSYGQVSQNLDATDSITSIKIESSSTTSNVASITVKIGKGGGTLVCSTNCETKTIY
jgi:type IV fimbrial biogenesis protein FimT